METIVYTPPKPTEADRERAKKQLQKMVVSLEETAYKLMLLGSTPVFFDRYSGGKMRAYAEIIQDISTNICQEYELYK
jgi:hypothetical protein